MPSAERPTPEPLPDEADLADDIGEVATEVWGARVDRAPRSVARTRVAGAVDRLLDGLARSVVDRPLEVRTLDDASARIERLAGALSTRAGSAWSLWAMARVRMLLARRWRVVPSATALAMGVSILTSVTCGTAELRVVGSLLVNRLRAAGVEPDPRLVRRVVVACYLDPYAARSDFGAPDRFAGARLVARWARDALPVWHPSRSLDRARRAARAVTDLDVESVAATPLGPPPLGAARP